jgi:hypothetical protein
MSPPTNAQKNKWVMMSYKLANSDQFKLVTNYIMGIQRAYHMKMLLIYLGNATTYTIGGSLATEYALTAYNANITGTDDQINGFESWFTVAKDPKV